jgi:hypothetical protein
VWQGVTKSSILNPESSIKKSRIKIMSATKEHNHDEIEAGMKAKEHPILFSTPMVQAILEGRKTQTRRTVKTEMIDGENRPWIMTKEGPAPLKCPFGKPGDLLWVRETWAKADIGFCFKVYNDIDAVFAPRNCWKPSIHMPKTAARIWLEVEEVRVERLQDISEEDAKAEGVKSRFSDLFQEERYDDYLDMEGEYRSPASSFQSLWQKINGPESWDANPWVWVVKFKVLSTKGVQSTTPANAQTIAPPPSPGGEIKNVLNQNPESRIQQPVSSNQ